jgi:hypothetical protein
MVKIGTATTQGARDQKMREGRLPIAAEFLAGGWGWSTWSSDSG